MVVLFVCHSTTLHLCEFPSQKVASLQRFITWIIIIIIHSPNCDFSCIKKIVIYSQVNNVVCADKVLLNNVDEVNSSIANTSDAIIRQIDAPVPLLFVFKKYTVYDEETKKPNHLMKLLNIDQWKQNSQVRQKN